MLRFICGYYEIEITGAGTEACLNKLAAGDIPFWRLRRTDTFSLRCRIFIRHWKSAERIIISCLCTAKILSRHRLMDAFSGLRKRPILIIGLTITYLLAFGAQNRVWVIRLQGPSEIQPERILRVLADRGVCFGARNDSIDTQELKNYALNDLPELRWIGVDTEGGIATVNYSVRTPPPPKDISLNEIANVVAKRDGVITGLTVYNGFPAVLVGDAVTEGQLLVSAFADWETHTQATRAIADVEAKTLRQISIATPEAYGRKIYTGRTETCITLILERKRIKISGNSSIFGARCDKMIKIAPLMLPGGDSLPFGVETVTLSEYTLVNEELKEEPAKQFLLHHAETLVRHAMTSGKIDSEELSIERTDSCLTADVEFSCQEIISCTVPVYLFGEDEIHGESHQRRTNGTNHQCVRFLR